jgi:hypothetical protein
MRQFWYTNTTWESHDLRHKPMWSPGRGVEITRSPSRKRQLIFTVVEVSTFGHCCGSINSYSLSLLVRQNFPLLHLIFLGYITTPPTYKLRSPHKYRFTLLQLNPAVSPLNNISTTNYSKCLQHSPTNRVTLGHLLVASFIVRRLLSNCLALLQRLCSRGWGRVVDLDFFQTLCACSSTCTLRRCGYYRRFHGNIRR